MSAAPEIQPEVRSFILLAWSSYGTHVEDADPLYGGGSEVTDFEPTADERNKHGLVVFLVTLTVAVHGTWYARNRYP